MTAENFIEALGGARPTTRGWSARCPAHADARPSLSISEGEGGRILLRCWASCTADEITAALGLGMRDLFADARPNRDAIKKAQRRREREEKIESAAISRSAVYRNADKIIDAATGVDISSWTPEQLDAAMSAVADARRDLIRESEEEGGERFEQLRHD